MDSVFGDLRYKGFSCYLDDLLLHGSTVEELLDKLGTALERLETAGLNLRLLKYDFFPDKLHYLGHVFSGGMILPNPAKVALLQSVRRPGTVGEARSLLGMLNYYHQYISHFALIASPISELLRGKVKKGDPTLVI